MTLKLSRLIFFGLISLSFFSCASYFKRKECESTNWFDYGKSVAMSGRRLTGDSFVNTCAKVEAKINYGQLDQGFKSGMATYCQPETVYATGRKGEFFSPDMCDGSPIKQLKAKHLEGVTAYCQKTNGVSAGAAGKPYNNICPKEMEADFIPEFNKGRKKYLVGLVGQKENEIDDLEREILQLERKKLGLEREMDRVGGSKTVQRQVSIGQGSYKEKVVVSNNDDDPETKSKRDRLRWDIDSVLREIDSKRDQQSNLRKQIREINTELTTL